MSTSHTDKWSKMAFESDLKKLLRVLSVALDGNQLKDVKKNFTKIVKLEEKWLEWRQQKKGWKSVGRGGKKEAERKVRWKEEKSICS